MTNTQTDTTDFLTNHECSMMGRSFFDTYVSVYLSTGDKQTHRQRHTCNAYQLHRHRERDTHTDTHTHTHKNGVGLVTHMLFVYRND